MYKLFSIEQANSLIPKVDQTLEQIKSTQAELKQIAARLRQAEPYSIEARNLFFESAFLAQELQGLKADIDTLGVKVADPKTGTLGFPGQIGAELVYLTWEPGEKSVSHFRRLTSPDLQPIPLRAAADQGSAAA